MRLKDESLAADSLGKRANKNLKNKTNKKNGDVVIKMLKKKMG